MNIETRGKLALLGADVDWRTTPIEVTPAARATDPLRIRENENWWKRAEPRDEQGREIIRLVERAGLGTLQLRDDVESEQQSLHHRGGGETTSSIAKHQRNKQRQREEGADELSPNETENIAQWFGRVAVHVTDTNKVLFDALRSFASRFPGSAPARQTLDRQLVATFLKKLR